MKNQNRICIVLACFILTILSGCADLQKNFIENNCNSSAAYANGLNAAKNGEEMETNYANICPGNIASLNNAYQNGYKYGMAHTPPSVKTQVNIYNGSNAARQCINDSYGEKFCGYSCVKTTFKVQCAQVPTNNCVKNTFDIKCGQNCRVDDFNDLKCDKDE